MSGETPSSSNAPRDEKFRMDDRQSAVFERLSRLVGPGTAAFYEDACRHMATKPPFRATTHIVGHLLREVEAGLCSVLSTVSEEKPTRDEPDGHKKKIKNILKGLGIEENEPVAVVWLGLTGKKNRSGLHKRAHRDNLEPVRPLDADFDEFWKGIQTILEVVLDKFEAQYANVVYKKLDELAQKEDPTAEDAETVHSNIPNNYVAHQHFFKQLSNPKWLPLLRKEGLFLNPPEPEVNTEEKTTRHVPWPAGIYLEKVASTEPQIVKEILNEAKEVDNSNVKGNLLRTSCNLRKADRLELLPKILSWVKTEHNIFQMGLSDPAQAIIEKFIEDGSEDAAFQVSAVLLEILPDPRVLPEPEEGSLYRPSLDPRARLDEWHYNEYFKKKYPKLVALNKKRAFDLACDLLLSYLTLEHSNKKESDHKFEDNSFISRGAIEDHEQNRDHRDTQDILINTVRDIGLELVNENPSSVESLFGELVARKWTIFKRLGLFLLAEVPDAATDLVVRELTNENDFDVNDIEHEYSRLMRTGFKLLKAEQQQIILGWIDEARHISESLKRVEADHGAERAQRSKEGWQRDKLSFIKADLPDAWKARYEALVSKLGEPQHPDFPAYHGGMWVGPESDKNAKEIAEMEIDTLVEYLQKWEPKEEQHFGPSKEGLGRELAGAVKSNPEKFSSAAKKFEGLDPTYIRSYIQAFVELVQNKHGVSWPNLVELCLWVVQQPVHIPNRTGDMMDQDPDWSWARKAVGSLISRGTNHNSIPFEFREKIWTIIEPLTHDKDPTPEDEAKRGESYDDAYSLAINTSRGEAMGAVMEYSLWVYRRIEEIEGKEKLKEGFNLMPEVREVLEFHLDPKNDPSIAVRAVYGRFFPWLLLLDREWVLRNVDKIMPPSQFDNRLYGAAWNTLLLYAPAYNDPFLILKERYMEAIKNLGKVDKAKRRFTDRDERLAEHLMLFYGRGKIEIDDPLLQEFWETANDEMREHALGFMGRSLKGDSEFDAPLLERLRVLWESRLAAAKASEHKEDYEKEVSAFGWWFASARFEDKWSADQYLESLEIGRKTQSDYFVIERLSDLVKTLPAESVKILNRMLLADEPGWIVMGHKGEISGILAAALKAPEPEAQKEARDLINRLVARGHTEYNDLLK